MPHVFWDLLKASENVLEKAFSYTMGYFGENIFLYKKFEKIPLNFFLYMCHIG
jgi:hypothetical protein